MAPLGLDRLPLVTLNREVALTVFLTSGYLPMFGEVRCSRLNYVFGVGIADPPSFALDGHLAELTASPIFISLMLIPLVGVAPLLDTALDFDYSGMDDDRALLEAGYTDVDVEFSISTRKRTYFSLK
jgi:hypothetical protein